MIVDLAALNQKELARHRRRIVEQSFLTSEQRGYRMPREDATMSESSLQEIPCIYDLHSQNQGKRSTRIQPLNHLIILNAKQHNISNITTKKGTISRLDLPNRQPSKSRINCTLSKQPSRQQVKSTPKSTWWCCLKQDNLEQFQTRELSLRAGSRHSKVLSGMFSIDPWQG